jgi:hypothetical protein
MHGSRGASKEVMGTFVVGLFVPLGNALFGAIIDMQTEQIGFRDEDTMRLWRVVLNVVVNTIANLFEVFMVYNKIMQHNRIFGDDDASYWAIKDLPWDFRKVFEPIAANPDRATYKPEDAVHVSDFQNELLAILFPAGLYVPLILIPMI